MTQVARRTCGATCEKDRYNLVDLALSIDLVDPALPTDLGLVKIY